MLRDIWQLLRAGCRYAISQLNNMNTAQAKIHDQALVICGAIAWLWFIGAFWLSSPWEYYPLLISFCIGGSYAFYRLHRFEAKGSALVTPFHNLAIAAVLSFLYTLPDRPAGLAVLCVLLFSYSLIRHIQQA